jgi:iron complex transport system permease protein
MFRNPLVSPDILGASAAAGFGAALALLLDFNSAGIQTTAFLFSLLGVLLTYLISRVHKTTPVMMMVLSGIVVGSFFGGLLSITKYVADPDEKLPLIVFWLMGSFSKATMKQFLNVLPSMLIGMIGLLAISWRINILAMGDKEARSLGVRTELLKGIIVICATLITASAVSVSGIIGWVGLVIPHAVRMLVGSNNRILLPATLFVGGIFLLSIDIVARSVTTAEIPLGIITSLIGAPFFALLLRQRKKELP